MVGAVPFVDRRRFLREVTRARFCFRDRRVGRRFMDETPFETIESAHEFVRLLKEQVVTVESDVQDDIDTAIKEGSTRRVDALRIVEYKLKQLKQHLSDSSRILNDLRALSRLLTADRQPAQP